jgi:hypothetical protein
MIITLGLIAVWAIGVFTGIEALTLWQETHDDT